MGNWMILSICAGMILKVTKQAGLDCERALNEGRLARICRKTESCVGILPGKRTDR
jgi:hypothetical protein